MPPACGSISQHLLPAEHLKTAQPVRLAAFEQVLEPHQLVRAGGDHQFAADLVRDAVFAAELDHLPDALDGQARFDGTRLVVEAGVEHAAVVAGLVPSDGRLFFEDGDFGIGKTLPEAVSSGKSYQPATDDEHTFRHGYLLF